MNVQNDGMFRAQDGTWISFSYTLWSGRLAMVSFFEHRGNYTPTIVWFREAM